MCSLTNTSFDFFSVMFLMFLFPDCCAMADGSIVWLFLQRWFLMILLFDFAHWCFFSVCCAMIFYFSDVLVCMQCGRPLQGVIDKKRIFFFKAGEGTRKFNNLIISKRTVPWRRSSKWRKTGVQGNIRILRSRNTWGQQRECKRKKRRERERELLAL